MEHLFTLPLHVEEHVPVVEGDSLLVELVSAAHMPVCEMSRNVTHPETNRIDAKFIVRAVNNHDALVTALANALNSLEYHAPDMFDDAEHEAKWNAGLQSCRDALANAEKP